MLLIKKSALLFVSTSLLINLAHSSGFQLWELDAASIGKYHAGIAAEASDASTAFNNPAGLVRIHNQQLVAGGSAIVTHFHFTGTIKTLSTASANTEGGGFNFVPFGHYAAPINENVVFGLSIVVPFGLKTNYGDDTATKYSAMLSSIKVIDYAPALGIALNEHFSIGLGADIQHMNGQFSQELGNPASPVLDTYSKNEGSDRAYGYHFGLLYSFNEYTRLGLSYHSKVAHHLKGNSTFTGALANSAEGGTQSSNTLTTNITLPPITTMSLFHAVNSAWDVLASVSYLQWNSVQHILLNNVAGIDDYGNAILMPVDIKAGFRNSWNYSIGTNYHVNENWLIRAGAGFDQTPTNNRYRNLQLPDSNRIALALGGHYQAFKTVGIDFGYTHVFAKDATIKNVSQTVGSETVITNGRVKGGADVYALQLKWDMT